MYDMPVYLMGPVRFERSLRKHMSDADTIEPELPGRGHIVGVAAENETLRRKGCKRQFDRLCTQCDLPARPRTLLSANDAPKEIPQLRLFHPAIGDARLCARQGKQLRLSSNEELQELPRPFRHHRPRCRHRRPECGNRLRSLSRWTAVLGEEAIKLFFQGECFMSLVEEKPLFRRNIVPCLQKPTELPPVEDPGVEDDAIEIYQPKPKIEDPRPHVPHITRGTG